MVERGPVQSSSNSKALIKEKREGLKRREVRTDWEARRVSGHPGKMSMKIYVNYAYVDNKAF